MSKRRQKTIGMSESALESIRGLDKVLGGRGLVVSIGSPTTGGVSDFYSNKLPKLEITTLNTKRAVKVEVSSVEPENDKLLHYLFRKTVEG